MPLNRKGRGKSPFGRLYGFFCEGKRTALDILLMFATFLFLINFFLLFYWFPSINPKTPVDSPSLFTSNQQVKVISTSKAIVPTSHSLVYFQINISNVNRVVKELEANGKKSDAIVFLRNILEQETPPTEGMCNSSSVASLWMKLGKMEESEAASAASGSKPPYRGKAKELIERAMHSMSRSFDCDGQYSIASQIAALAKRQKHWGLSETWHRQLWEINPNFDTSLRLIKACMKTSNWETWNENLALVMKEARSQWYSRKVAAIDAFTALHLPFNLTEINGFNSLSAERIKSNVLARGRKPFEWPLATRVKRNERIRVGYVSHDLTWSSVGLVIMSLFAFHSRDNFEIFCYFVHDNRIDKDRRDKVYQKLRRECEHHIELGAVPYETWISQIKEKDEIDIMVDLNVYTAGHRADLFVLHPAPITVAWLGLGTSTGADYMDYLIADGTTVPKEKNWEGYYKEKIVRMPFTYHIADHKQFYGPPIEVTREDRPSMGIRQDSFVFCNFANVIRWSPDWFDRVSSAVKAIRPHGQIMMRDANEFSRVNLFKAARIRGLRVNETHPLESEIVLIPKESSGTHINKKTACDVNMDTPYYNGHSCGLDLFWAGVPAITLAHQTLAGRAAASYSAACNIDPSVAVAETWDEFEQLAIQMARDKSGYQAIDTMLHQERARLPLFDTWRFVKNLENGYEQMFDTWLKGQPPDHIDVIDQGEQPQHHPLYPPEVWSKRLPGAPFYID